MSDSVIKFPIKPGRQEKEPIFELSNNNGVRVNSQIALFRYNGVVGRSMNENEERIGLKKTGGIFDRFLHST